jgi:hypothetical protein
MFEQNQSPVVSRYATQAAKAECSNHLSYKHRRDGKITFQEKQHVKKSRKKHERAEAVVPGGLEGVIF